MANDLLLSHRQELTLEGYVDLRIIHQVVDMITRMAHDRPRTRFELNCALVHDFSGYSLAEMVKLRRELQWQGSDLALTHCTDYVRNRMAVPVFEALLAAEPVGSHTPEFLPQPEMLEQEEDEELSEEETLAEFEFRADEPQPPACPPPHSLHLFYPRPQRHWLN